MPTSSKSVTLDPMTSISTTKPLNKPFSEVVSSMNETVFAHCYRDEHLNKQSCIEVTQGRIVKIVSSYDTSYAAFGIIANINNTTLDTSHKAQALGLDDQELKSLQAQIMELLRKEVEIYLFAYQEGSHLVCLPPTKPLMVHDFVYLATEDDQLKLTENLTSVINLVKKYKLQTKLVCNLIKTGYELRNHDYKYLLEKAQEMSLAFSDELDTLIFALKDLSSYRQQ